MVLVCSDGRVEDGDGLARRLALPPRVVGLREGSSFSALARIAARPGARTTVRHAVCGVAWGKMSSSLSKRHHEFGYAHAHLIHDVV